MKVCINGHVTKMATTHIYGKKPLKIFFSGTKTPKTMKLAFETQVLRTMDQGVPGSRPGRVAVCCGLEQVTFTACLVLVKPRKPWTYN